MLGNLRHYARILQRFWGAAIAVELEYRVNVAIATLSSLLGMSGSLFGLFLFYQQDYTFEGWSWDEALIVLGMFTLFQGFSATLLAPNLNKIVTHVQNGTLDFILIKPVSAQFWLSLHTISPWGLPDALFGMIIISYAGQRLGLAPLDYLRGMPAIAFGFLSLYSLWFILGATSIWFVKIYNVTEVLRGLIESGRFPIVAYPTAYRFFFTFIIPVAFLTTVPAQMILNRATSWWVLGSALLSMGLFWISHRFWRFALRFYTSASS
ncbi:MAG: ABC transporter permease [Elainellaceae cyanobacterium]